MLFKQILTSGNSADFENYVSLTKNNMEDFITIAVFNYTHEIEILKHRLNIEGIAYYFENEATASVVPMYSIALGGIRLKIHPNDKETVLAILDELDQDSFLKIVWNEVVNIY